MKNNVYIRKWLGKPYIHHLQDVFQQLPNCIFAWNSVLTHDFQHTQRTAKLKPALDVLKIMCKKWSIIMIKIQHLKAVEKHLASNEKCCRYWNFTRNILITWWQFRLRNRYLTLWPPAWHRRDSGEHVAHDKRAMRTTISRATVIILLFHCDKRRSACRSRFLFSHSF